MWAVSSLELSEDTVLQVNLSRPVLNHLKTLFFWQLTHRLRSARLICVSLVSPLGNVLNLQFNIHQNTQASASQSALYEKDLLTSQDSSNW